MRHRKIILKWASASAKLGFRLLAVSAEITLRSNFGVRYVGTLLAGYLLFSFYALIVQSFSRGRLLGLYFVWITIRLVGHIFKMLLPQSRLVHSQSSGTPWRFWQNLSARQWLVELVFEPSLLFLLGWIVQSHDLELAVWLVASGCSLLVKGVIYHWNFYNHLLDVVDARIEGEQVSDAVRRRNAPPPRRAGVSNPVRAAEQQQPAPQSLEGIFSNLDPSLRNLFQAGEQKPTARPAGKSDENPQRHKHDDGPLGHLPRITSRRNHT